MTCEQAQKCTYFQDKFEYLTDQAEGIAKLNKEMEELGLEFIFLDGDNPVCSVICCAHKQIVLECDVLYGHHNKKGIFVVDEERFLASLFTSICPKLMMI